ncbi:hypothetical protein BBP40_002135 [Aspergillus hancockii]|nr:hypothetical protein BBP40_002135 [Aspergillus hancockii]
MSALVRYAACALAAKQLGQMRDAETRLRQTDSRKIMLQGFTDSKLDFLWYGAKYYERAIQLLARQILMRTVLFASYLPVAIYQSGLTPQDSDHSLLGENDSSAAVLRMVTACILCQYEDLSLTVSMEHGRAI